MRKKKILIALITILLLPFNINAAVRNNYDITKENTNIYINNFDRNDVYIIKSTPSFNVPYIYNNGALSVDTYFKKGGLLNRYEFLVSKTPENDTYLFTGNNYWTLTENGTKVYMIDNSATDNISLQEKTTLSGGRITEYVREETGVSGSGKYIDPWVFIERFKVTAQSSNTSWGTVTPSEKYVNKGENITFSISPGSEYEYSNNDCGATYSNGKLILSNIQADKDCIVNFKKKVYTLTYNNNGGSGCTNKKVTSGNTWGTLCTPTRTNYDFLGWYTSSTGGTKISSSTVATKDQTVYAHWEYTTLKLTYNNNGGSGCTSKNFVKNQKVGTLCVPTKSTNEFAGWYTSATGGTEVTSDTVLSEATTVYAHWTPTCFAFTPSTGTITDYYDYKGNNSANGSCPRSVTIPSTISGKTVLKIGNYSFEEKNITSVTIPNTVTEIGYSAFGNNKLTSVTIPSSVITIKNGAFEYNSITTLTLNEGLKTIGGYAFIENAIKSVKTPSTLETIGYSTFEENNISSLTLNSGLKSIGDFAFFRNKIPNVTIPTSVTSLGNASFNDNQLPDSVATLYKRNSDGSEDKTTVVSYGGSKRYNVVVPSTVNIIDDFAYYYNDITSITIPTSVTKVGDHGVAFNDISTINIPSSVTYIDYRGFANNWASTINYTSSNLTYLGNAAFNGNSTSTTNALKYKKNPDGTDDTSVVVSYSANRKNITLPSTVKEIADDAFFNAFVNSITIPEGVTKIGSGAFRWCYLSSVTIPSTVQTIGYAAFEKYYDSSWSENLNPLTKIVNKTGKSFSWHDIINNEYYYDSSLSDDYYLKDYEFETGIVKNPRGNVTITN
ncbi:MAG: leucine-rich repeat protein [Bacilli bacterium]